MSSELLIATVMYSAVDMALEQLMELMYPLN